MIILLESPKSILQKEYAIHGANKISDTLSKLFLEDRSITFIIVSDLTSAECDQFHLQNTRHYYCNYSTLFATLVQYSLRPSIAITWDSSIHNLLHFRNYHHYSFPVIGLIHALGFKSDIQSISSALPYMTVYDGFICPSENTKQTAVKLNLPSCNAFVSPFGLDTSLFKPLDTKHNIRRKYNVPLNKTIALLLSRISPAYKMDLTPLIRQIPYLISKQPSLMFYIVGSVLDPSYVKELKLLIQHLCITEYILWQHHPDPEIMYEYYQASDFFISMPDCCSETFGLTVMEAMSCGLPVIIHHFAGYKAHITDGVEGFYIDTVSLNNDSNDYYSYQSNAAFGSRYSQTIASDIDMLCHKICLLSADASLQNTMGQAARDTILNRNTLSHMKEQYMSIFSAQIKKAQEESKPLPVSNLYNVCTLLDHQVTHRLDETHTISLTPMAKHALSQGETVYFFEKQKHSYFLITVILNCLRKGPKSLHDLYAMIDASKETIHTHFLFLMKQGFIALTK